MWVEVRDDNGKLLFKYNPIKNLIEIVQRGRYTLIDLDRIVESFPQSMPDKKTIEMQSHIC